MLIPASCSFTSSAFPVPPLHHWVPSHKAARLGSRSLRAETPSSSDASSASVSGISWRMRNKLLLPLVAPFLRADFPGQMSLRKTFRVFTAWLLAVGRQTENRTGLGYFRIGLMRWLFVAWDRMNSLLSRQDMTRANLLVRSRESLRNRYVRSTGTS
jgi:hypothetical protein